MDFFRRLQRRRKRLMGGRRRWTDNSHADQFFNDFVFTHSHAESTKRQENVIAASGAVFQADGNLITRRPPDPKRIFEKYVIYMYHSILLENFTYSTRNRILINLCSSLIPFDPSDSPQLYSPIFSLSLRCVCTQQDYK